MLRQFTPRSARPLTRETYTQAADNWSRTCSQLDDYARAGNARGVTRTLNRLLANVTSLRERHQVDPEAAFREPFDSCEWERRVTK